MKCASAACTHDAVALPEVQIPAVGFSFDNHSPISVTLATPLCAECMALLKLDPSIVIDAFKLRAMIDPMTAGRGLQMPDYARARVLARRLDAVELAAFLARSREGLH